MNKDEALRIIKLLSALESWSFSAGQRMPEYLLDDLQIAQEILRREVLK